MGQRRGLILSHFLAQLPPRRGYLVKGALKPLREVRYRPRGFFVAAVFRQLQFKSNFGKIVQVYTLPEKNAHSEQRAF